MDARVAAERAFLEPFDPGDHQPRTALGRSETFRRCREGALFPPRLGNGAARDDRHQSAARRAAVSADHAGRSEEHTYELQSLMRQSYAVICLTKKKSINYNIK